MNGRAVTITHHVALGDVRPDSTMRLDAIARLVQDVADVDAADAPVEGMGIWILRRLDLAIAHTPRFRADLTARTWCSGFGARWAERRTDICAGELLCIEATGLWVHVDAERGVPAPLPAGSTRSGGNTQATGASPLACDTTRRRPTPCPSGGRSAPRISTSSVTSTTPHTGRR